MSNLISRAHQKEAQAQACRDEAARIEAQNASDCGCEVVKAVATQLTKTAAVGLLAATTGVVLPSI